jgi:hypothetical protein
VGCEIFRTCPDRPWGPLSLLYNGYRVFPGGKERPGRDADTSPPSNAVGHERVELYLYSPYGSYGLYRASVPVQGWPLLLISKLLKSFLYVLYWTTEEVYNVSETRQRCDSGQQPFPNVKSEYTYSDKYRGYIYVLSNIIHTILNRKRNLPAPVQIFLLVATQLTVFPSITIHTHTHTEYNRLQSGRKMIDCSQ